MQEFYFPNWVNKFTLMAIGGGAAIAGYLATCLFAGIHPEIVNVGHAPKQPIPYSHKLHVGQLKLDCRYCHNTVDQAGHAAIPPTAAPTDMEAMTSGAGLLAGRPVPDVQVRIDNGEILVAGPHVNQGYLDPARDAETKVRDGDTIWHRTGDAGRLDDNGQLWLLGRHGADVNGLHPFEVEAAARQWPGVRRVALANVDGATLAIEGDDTHLATWRDTANELFNITDVRPLKTIPVDRRHGSKIDYPALLRALNV